MLKKIVKIVLFLILVIGIFAGYIFFRLHNTIENVLEAKNGWRSEVLEFPLLFAGDLEYTGEEHIRFAPGWGETDRDDYFSYVFLWIIEEDPSLNSSVLENIINTYFDGLMNTGAITKFNFFKDIPKTTSSIKQINPNIFEGSIHLYDEFFAQEMILLNAKIKSEYCPTKKKHLLWFYLSPQADTHHIWEELMTTRLTIDCL